MIKTINGHEYHFRELKFSSRRKCEKIEVGAERWEAGLLESLTRPDGTLYADIDELSEDLYNDDFEEVFDAMLWHVFHMKRERKEEGDDEPPAPLASENDSAAV